MHFDYDTKRRPDCGRQGAHEKPPAVRKHSGRKTSAVLSVRQYRAAIRPASSPSWS